MAILVFGCFAGAYFLSYALRSVNAVIAPPLTQAFGLSNAQLGSLSSAYFFAFALMQLPLGIWLDRYGSRRVNACLLLVAAAGCAVFASASGVTTLWVGRALIGVGVSGALMSALKGYRFWYSATRLQQLTAWMLVAGTAGALTVTVPVQLVLPVVGWRGVFWGVAVLLVLVAATLWALVPRDEERHAAAMHAPAPAQESRPAPAGVGAVPADAAATPANAAAPAPASASASASAPGGYAEVFRDPYFWRFALLAVIAHGHFVSLQTLWAGPWFAEVLGMSAVATSEALFAFNLALMIGFFSQGWLLPWLARAGWSIPGYSKLGLTLVLLVELAIALVTAGWSWLLWPLLALVATFFTALQTHVSLSFRQAITGRVYTAYNLMLFGGIFLNQWLFGVVIDLFQRGGHALPDAFRAALLVWLLPQLGAAALLALSKARPANERAAQPAGGRAA